MDSEIDLGQCLQQSRGPTRWIKPKGLVPLESWVACESKKPTSSGKAQVISFLEACENGGMKLTNSKFSVKGQS